MKSAERLKNNLTRPDKPLNRSLVVAAALAVGALNGLFGGGGGMLVVPVLTFLCGLDVKKAHATAIVTILPLCLVSAAVYWKAGFYDWNVGIWTTLGVIGGGILGSMGLKKLSSQTLSVLFYGLMLAAGIKMLIG